MAKNKTIDCRSKEGVLIGLIDSIISISRIAGPMIEKMGKDELSQSVYEAMKDLTTDEDVWKILRAVHHKCIISEERAKLWEKGIKSLKK